MMDRWKLFEILQGNREPDAALVEMMDPEEVKEGVIEFLIQKGREIDGGI